MAVGPTGVVVDEAAPMCNVIEVSNTAVHVPSNVMSDGGLDCPIS